jgi:hypothetical protein
LDASAYDGLGISRADQALLDVTEPFVSCGRITRVLYSAENGYAQSGADWRGTGIIFIGAGAALTIRDCVFTGNETRATYVTTSTAIVFKTGDASDREEGAQSTLIENCLFYKNKIGGGGWTSVGGGKATLIIQQQPGTSVYENKPEVINCTFADNELYSSVSSSAPYTGGIRVVLLHVKSVKNTLALT